MTGLARRAAADGCDMVVVFSGDGTVSEAINGLAGTEVSLGIIPLGTDRSKSMWPVEAFWMFDEAQVAVELVSAYLTITQPHEIAMYMDVFAGLAAQAVYGPPARKLIADAIAALDE